MQAMPCGVQPRAFAPAPAMQRVAGVVALASPAYTRTIRLSSAARDF
jgi:hypothetical protein